MKTNLLNFLLACPITFMCILLIGCSGNANTINQSETVKPTTITPSENNVVNNTANNIANNVATTGSKKTLVVYYSATGSTKEVANVIKNVLNADIFEVVPTNVYTSADLNYSNDNSRVSREHSDTSKRDVPLTNTKVENWESYDTIYIGYPLWWGIAAWPMNNFVKENDFTGKTIIPFCTSASSGFGKSDEPLKALDSKGVWKEGRRFGMSANENEIKTWVESMK